MTVKEALPFSLSCFGCDWGDSINSHEEATLQGWTDIEEEPDGESYNYLGWCPECRESEEKGEL